MKNEDECTPRTEDNESAESEHTMEVTVVRHGEGFHNLNTQGVVDSGWSFLSNLTSFSLRNAFSDSRNILNGAVRAARLRDPGLTEEGLKQAQGIKDKLLSKEFDIIIVSPMQRTVQTALEIFGKSSTHTLVLHPLCCETRILFEGSNAGTLKLDLQQSITEYCKSKSYNVNIDYGLLPDDDWWVSSTESTSSLNTRSNSFREYLISQQCSNALVVSHGTFLFSLTGGDTLGTAEYRTYTCSTNGLEIINPS